MANPVVTPLGPKGKVLVPEKDFINVLNDTLTGDECFGPYFNKTWEYSNVSHGLVELVIDRPSGKRYADFISEEILKPLGMNDTAIYKSQLSPDGNIANSYIRLSDGTWYKQSDYEWTNEYIYHPIVGFNSWALANKTVVLYVCTYRNKLIERPLPH
ncbi:hypothetical protein F4804DRAFT_334830 [Jackrogersella minutella]|nr:hypothetical protein F4804DRAFT_334830 [Jackrogersella minutella]